MAKAFSIEDGNLQNKPIITSKTITYKDVDLTFEKSTSGDVYKKSDAAAVKQAIKNLLLTSKTEKPFNPSFGGNLYSSLFSLSTDYTPSEIKENIKTTIRNFEPRARVLRVDVVSRPDTHSLLVTVRFQVVNTVESIELNVDIARLR